MFPRLMRLSVRLAGTAEVSQSSGLTPRPRAQVRSQQVLQRKCATANAVSSLVTGVIRDSSSEVAFQVWGASTLQGTCPQVILIVNCAPFSPFIWPTCPAPGTSRLPVSTTLQRRWRLSVRCRVVVTCPRPSRRGNPSRFVVRHDLRLLAQTTAWLSGWSFWGFRILHPSCTSRDAIQSGRCREPQTCHWWLMCCNSTSFVSHHAVGTCRD